MTTNVYYDGNTDWEELMHRICVCGHELYMHGFTQHPNLIFDNEGNWVTEPGAVLWVSGCVMCPYDHEKSEIVCSEFRQA